MRKPRTLLAPQAGGPIFVPASRAAPGTQADLNAAINLGLRAIAAPDAHHILVKIRAEAGEDAAFFPRLGNKREKARFGTNGKPPAIVFRDDDRKKAASLTRRAVNFFVDIGGVATFDRAEHTALAATPLASGRGLWKSVKDAQWTRCMELNRGRIENAKLKEEQADKIPM